MTTMIPLEDVELNAFDEGEGDAIVFIHGFPLDHSMWRFQLEEFARTHRVIAPDLRGFGQSEDSAGVVTMERLADDIAGLLDCLEIPGSVTVCGLSMGGYVAWQFWKRHPYRLRRLIQCDTRAVADSMEARQTRLESSDRVLREGPDFLAATMPEKMFSPVTRSQQPDLVNEVQQTIIRNSPVGISAALLGMAARPDVTDWLPRIQVPTLLLVGADDVISTPDEMTSIATGIPGATLKIIPQAGHLAPLEQPQQVNRILREFLQQS